MKRRNSQWVPLKGAGVRLTLAREVVLGDRL